MYIYRMKKEWRMEQRNKGLKEGRIRQGNGRARQTSSCSQWSVRKVCTLYRPTHIHLQPFKSV